MAVAGSRALDTDLSADGQSLPAGHLQPFQ